MWKVEYKKRFLKELSKLPEVVQPQVEKVVFEDLICENPFDLRYLEQMRGGCKSKPLVVKNYAAGLWLSIAVLKPELWSAGVLEYCAKRGIYSFFLL